MRKDPTFMTDFASTGNYRDLASLARRAVDALERIADALDRTAPARRRTVAEACAEIVQAEFKATESAGRTFAALDAERREAERRFEDDGRFDATSRCEE